MSDGGDTIQGLAFTGHVCHGDYKLCKDCIYFAIAHSNELLDPSLGICSAFLSLVDASQMHILCQDARSSGLLCGKNGELWEARPE